MGNLDPNDPRLQPPPPPSRWSRALRSAGFFFIGGAYLGFCHFPEEDDRWSVHGRAGLAVGALLGLLGFVLPLLLPTKEER